MLPRRASQRVRSLSVKYLVAWVVLAGCFASSTPRPQQVRGIVPPPKVLRPLPLKPGQWARYRERDADGDIGSARFAVIATSFCGTWVRAELSGHGSIRTWLLCVGNTGDPPREHFTRALLDSDDGDARTIDLANAGEYGAELDALATRIVAPELAGAYGREDVTVPGGTFEESLRTDDGTSTTWLHPLVPLSGAVKIVDRSGREDVLDDFGDAAADVPDRFVEDSRTARRHRPFAAIGLGYNRHSDPIDPAGNSGSAKIGILGWHVARKLDAIAEVAQLSLGGGTGAAASDGGVASLVAGGVRWCPLRRSSNAGITFEPYLQGTIGYAELVGTVPGIGVMGTAGWLAGRGGDWGIAAQLDVLAARFVESDTDYRRIGIRYAGFGAVSVGLLLQLELR